MWSANWLLRCSRVIDDSPLGRYGLSLLVVLFALAACRPLSALFANSAPFILLPAAVAGAAHYLGLGPAILTLVLSTEGPTWTTT